MKYKTIPGVITAQFCDKYFLVTSDETMKISETAYICLKRLEQGADTQDLCCLIGDKYEIDDKRVLLSDVSSLIMDLLRKRLLVRCTQ